MIQISYAVECVVAGGMLLLPLIKCLNPLVHLAGVAGLVGAEDLCVMDRNKGGNGLDAAVAPSILVLVNIAFQPLDAGGGILQCIHV